MGTYNWAQIIGVPLWAGLDLGSSSAALPSGYSISMPSQRAYLLLSASTGALRVEARSASGGSVLDSFTLPAPTTA